MCVGFFVCPCQSSMPTSSSPVSTPSAWCHVAWEKTRRCILSSALPWYTQRRLSLSRDVSSSSTTPTVSSLTIFFFPFLISFLDKKQTKVHFSHLILHPYPPGPAHPSLLPLFFTLASSSLFCHSDTHFVLPCSCSLSSFSYFIIAFLLSDFVLSPLFSESPSFLFILPSFSPTVLPKVHCMLFNNPPCSFLIPHFFS